MSTLFDPTTGHKHTGAAGDGPEINPSAFDTVAWPAFRAYQSFSQSLSASTETTVAFQAKNYDQGNVYSTGTYGFTAPATGIYLVAAYVAFPGTADGVYREVKLVVNGLTDSVLSAGASGAAKSARMGGCVPLKLNAGDYVIVRVLTDVSESISIGTVLTYFTAVRIA